ncbi:hypothetical protein EQG64_00520 [Streptomyces sp. S6]|nr:hypothetical protein EQG64_00520 [Streptomyces sp. S6]
MRRPVRAIARRRDGLVAELPGHPGNAASVRAGRRTAGGSLTTGPRMAGLPQVRLPVPVRRRPGPAPSDPEASPCACCWWRTTTTCGR